MGVYEEKSLDSVDKFILVLPFLAILEVASALYVESLGYPLVRYEAGFFSRFFVGAGLTYVYAVIYLLIIVGFAYVLWYIKKKLSSSHSFDKVIFLFLVSVTCYIYMRLTAAFIGNFLLPHILSRGVNWFSLNLLIYLSTALSLVFYLWRDVIIWLRAKGEGNE